MMILRIRLSAIRAGWWAFSGGPVGKNLPVNAGDLGTHMVLITVSWSESCLASFTIHSLSEERKNGRTTQNIL